MVEYLGRMKMRRSLYWIIYCVYAISFITSVCTAKKTFSPPKFQEMPEKEMIFRKFEPITLPCVASSNPTYTWKKDGQNLKMGLEIRQHPGTGTIMIEEPWRGNEGEYQCFATNSLGTAVSIKTILKIANLEPFPTVRVPKIHRPEVGSSLTLTCHAPFSYPAAVIYWGQYNRHRPRPIENTERISLDYEGTLYFSNVELSDAMDGGDYVCVTFNHELHGLVQGDDQKIEPQLGSESPRQERPSLMWASDNGRGREVGLKGQTKKMKCIFSGYPTPTVTWERMGQPLQGKIQYRSFGQEIIIPDMDYGDAGAYQCLSQNLASTEPTRHIISLIVESAPHWKDGNPPEDVNTSEEETAQFDCRAEGVPKPTITWSINGQPLSSIAPSRRRIEGYDYIRFVNVTKMDTLVLQCNASNKHGYIFANAFLNVLAEPPTFIHTTRPVIKVAMGQTVVLNCSAFGSPKPTIAWQRGTKVMKIIKSDRRFKIEPSGNLRIKDVKITDQDRYYCKISNKFGSDQSDVQLIVRGKMHRPVANRSGKIESHNR